jgi:predicted TIM-barrel fold metal-dependent hydrolase
MRTSATGRRIYALRYRRGVANDTLEQAEQLAGRYEEEVRRLRPPGADVFDAHVHCGRDIDGFVSEEAELLAFLERSGASRAFCFCLDEPDRHPGFRAANDRTLAAAERSGGVLVPFVRLDLGERPVEEAVRCLDLGACGIKLHPRAQGFPLDDERLEPIFAVAAERRVPILIHGGRGLPPIADHLARLADRHPETTLIIAHGGIADLGALAGAFAGRPGVFFDTSIWGAVDMLDLYCRVSPQQLLYASDFPYGQHPQALLLDLRIGRLAGFSDDEVCGVLGRNGARIADGAPPEPLGPPKLGTRTLVQPIQLSRIHTYLTMTTPLLWTRQPDVIGALGLAINAAAERDGQAEVCERISELLSCARALWLASTEMADDERRLRAGRRTLQLIHLADIEALTAAAPSE